MSNLIKCKAHGHNTTTTTTTFVTMILVFVITAIWFEPSKPSKSIEIVVDVNKIAGKSYETVIQYLGKPSETCVKNKYGWKCIFPKGKTSIVFINGKADWITIEDLAHLKVEGTSINSVGLPAYDYYHTSIGIRWDNIPNLVSVNMVNNVTNHIDYIYIKVHTE